MGYKKLDEVMEQLTDELEGFNRSIGKFGKAYTERGQYQDKTGYHRNRTAAPGTSGMGKSKEQKYPRIHSQFKCFTYLFPL